MIRPGLVSVTFRKLTPREIVTAAVQAKLQGIEWGGDVHVPHGKIDVAREVAAMTRDAGLAISSYGSYYRLGDEAKDLLPRVIETAIALGAPVVRVWAGRVGSKDATAAMRESRRRWLPRGRIGARSRPVHRHRVASQHAHRHGRISAGAHG